MRWIEQESGGDDLIGVHGRDAASAARQDEGVLVFLVEERANPSSDYFVLPALRAGGYRVVRCGFADLPARQELDGAAVVFVRYVPPAWARLVDNARGRLARLVFFMDDDVFDVRASAGMPWRFRFKLMRLAARWQGWLRRQDAELWVSTPWLQQKYATWRPLLVQPMPLPQAGPSCRVFYHGSASHDAEIRWLKPVLAEALQRDQRLVFEIIGSRKVWRLYRDLPRVNVIHPMKWQAYQAFMAMSGRHIGLAPLLDVPFNRARACTKFYDITRCGAVGIYSPGSVCEGVVRHGSEGLIVALHQSAWVEAILKLAADTDLRRQMLLNAQSRQAVLGGEAQRNNADNLKSGGSS